MIKDFTSSLMLSAHNEKHLKKIPQLQTECIMLNLEDGVSAELKPRALELCKKYLLEYKTLDKMFVVRVNPLDNGGIEEIKELNSYFPDAIRIPKVQTVDDVYLALSEVDEAIDIHLSIETAKAWNNLTDFKVDKRVTTYYLGILDLFADLGLSHELLKQTNPTVSYVLSHFLITTLSSNVKPVSFVYQDYKDTQTFREWVLFEKVLGYKAKGCISPAQADLVDEILTTDRDEILKAKKIVELFEAKQKLGITGFSDESFGFIDEPIYKGALAVLKAN